MVDVNAAVVCGGAYSLQRYVAIVVVPTVVAITASGSPL
jgi:hypothetical protein